MSPSPPHDDPILLSREQIRRIDHLAVERYGIPSLLLMENAGRNATAIICEQFGQQGRAAVICGTGNNGGDGFVVARHLHNAGWSVRGVLAGRPEKMTPDAGLNFGIIERMKLPLVVAADFPSLEAAVQSVEKDDLLVDALLGTGFSGEVRSPLKELIDRLNDRPKRAMVAIDVPSGLDCDTGAASTATIRADLTITFVARKRGFDAPSALPYLGRIEVADIGSPRELLLEVLQSHA
jgi:NAD(P)H-hydrate epimerase